MERITIKEVQKNFENKYIALLGRKHFEAATKESLDEKVLEAITEVENKNQIQKVQDILQKADCGLWINKSNGRYNRGDSSGRLHNAACYKLENTLTAVIFYHIDHHAATANLVFFAKKED